MTEAHVDDSRNDRRKVAAIATLIVLALLVSLVGAYFWIHSAQVECDRRRDARADIRAVWLHVLEISPSRNPQAALDFRMYLDDRLPPLDCAGTWHTKSVELEP